VPIKHALNLDLMQRAFYLSEWHLHLTEQLNSYRHLYWIIRDQRFSDWLKEESNFNLLSPSLERSHWFLNEMPINIAFETYCRQMIVILVSYLDGIIDNFLMSAKTSENKLKKQPKEKLIYLLQILSPQTDVNLNNDLISLIEKRNRIVHELFDEIVRPQDVESGFSIVISFLGSLAEPARNLNISIEMSEEEK